MLDEKQVKEKEDTIKTSQARMDELSVTFDDTRKNIAERTGKIKELNASIEDENQNIRELNALLSEIKQEHQPLATVVYEAEELLKTDAFDKKVQGFIDEYTDFYEALELRLIKLQEEYKESMSLLFSFVHPKEVIEIIRKNIETINFTQQSVDYRNAKATYEVNIKEICTVKANGGKPSFYAAKSISRNLDAFLEDRSVIDLWHKKL